MRGCCNVASTFIGIFLVHSWYILYLHVSHVISTGAKCVCVLHIEPFFLPIDVGKIHTQTLGWCDVVDYFRKYFLHVQYI